MQLKAKYLVEPSDALSIYCIADYNKLTGAGSFFDSTWRSFGAGSAAQAPYTAAGGAAGADNFLYAGDGDVYRRHVGGAQASVSYVFDFGWELSNLAAWRTYSVEQSLDIDYLPQKLVNVNHTVARYDQFSNELRLALPATKSIWT
jgi:iron complex outermembrane recepter protein